MSKNLNDAQWDLNFRVVTNAHYHALRRSFYLLISRSTNFLIITTGTAGVATILTNFTIAATAIGFATAVLGSAQLVFDVDGMVRKHEELQRLYHELAAKIAIVRKSQKTLLQKHEANLHIISATEPPTYRALQAIAHNITVAAYFQPDDAAEHLKRLSTPQKIFKNLYRFANTNFH